MATAKQEEMASRRQLVLKTLKKLKKARYQEILDAILKSGKSDKEINYRMVVNVFRYWSDKGQLDNDKGSVEDRGNGVWEYQKPKKQKQEPSFAAYGYRWERDKVDWKRKRGRPSKTGIKEEKKLEGIQKGKNAQPINFADKAGIYFLHNGDRTVYVGRVEPGKNAGRGLYDRLREHTLSKDKKLYRDWDKFSWFVFHRVEEDDIESRSAYVPPLIQNPEQLLQVLTTIEAVIINGIKPSKNARGGDVHHDVHYEQVPDASKK